MIVNFVMTLFQVINPDYVVS